MAGKEISLSLDGFGRQKVLGEKDSIAQKVLNLLFMKPGNLPNMPHLGIDINQYLYSQEGSFDTTELQSKIVNQCSELMPYMINGDVTVTFTENEGIQILLIGIPVSVDGDDLLLIGLTPTEGSGTLRGASSSNIVYEFTKLL